MRFKSLLFRLWAHVAIIVLSAVPVWAASLPDDQPLAMVNDVAITRQDLEIEQAQVIAEMHLRNRPFGRNRIVSLKKELIENLIDRELLYQKAQDKNLQIRNRWVERSLAELKEKIGTSKSYASYLESNKIDETRLKERLRKGLIVQRLLRREVVRQIKVSEAEMQAFFRKHPDYFVRPERVRARHILIKTKKSPKTDQRGEALLRIQSIQNMLYEGANFAAMALEYSEDPSKSRGGDLGYLTNNQMIPVFSDAAFALETGEVSDIIETHLGFHLIQMVDRKSASPMAYRDTRDKIERTLRRNKEKKAADAYLARLKKAATIQRLVTFK